MKNSRRSQPNLQPPPLPHLTRPGNRRPQRLHQHLPQPPHRQHRAIPTTTTTTTTTSTATTKRAEQKRRDDGVRVCWATTVTVTTTITIVTLTTAAAPEQHDLL